MRHHPSGRSANLTATDHGRQSASFCALWEACIWVDKPLLAKLGPKAAIQEDPGIAEGVNTFNGVLTYGAVAEAQQRAWTPIAELAGA